MTFATEILKNCYNYQITKCHTEILTSGNMQALKFLYYSYKSNKLIFPPEKFQIFVTLQELLVVDKKHYKISDSLQYLFYSSMCWSNFRSLYLFLIVTSVTLAELQTCVRIYHNSAINLLNY
jgi:hypothetical protein